MIVDFDRVDGIIERRVKGKLKTQEVDISPFFKVVDKEERIAEPANRVQVREFLINPKKVNKIAQLMLTNGDRNVDPMDIVINYPNDAGQAIVGGNHTVGGLFEIGRDSGKSFVYDFFEDFGGKVENVKRFANLVNKPHDGTFCDFITEDDVKRELYDLMDARQKAGLEAVPTEDEKRKFLKPYTFVTLATLGQWIGHHPTYGGRVAPRIIYDEVKLANMRVSYEHMEAYAGWNVLTPRTLAAAKEEALATAVKVIASTKIKKVIIPIYASTKVHADKLAKGQVQVSIQDLYDKIGKVLGVTLKAEFLKYE